MHQVSIVLPIVNETFSLEQTVDIIESTCQPQDVLEYVVVYSKKITTPESLETAQMLNKKLGVKLKLVSQKLPYIGGAIRTGFQFCSGTHILLMASDLETNPRDVRKLIDTSKEHPEKIITASRWLEEGGFTGYSPIKLVLNYIFQKFFSILYNVSLTDMTYGFRIFPSEVAKSQNWVETRHPFLFETILRPLAVGVEVLEIPSQWKARSEGESQNTFWRNFEYFKTGLKLYLSRNSKPLTQRF